MKTEWKIISDKKERHFVTTEKVFRNAIFRLKFKGSFRRYSRKLNSTRKNNGFWLLWGIFKEYIRQNIIMVVFREANSHSVDICRMQKNQCKRRSWRKNWFKLWFFQAPKHLWGFKKKERYVVHIIKNLKKTLASYRWKRGLNRLCR